MSAHGHHRDVVDRLGALAGFACAVHCALCALLPGVLAPLGLGAFLGHEAEWSFTVVALVFASLALAMGFRRHRSVRVASVLAVGIVGLLLARLLEGRFGHLAGTALAALAGAALVVGHVSNVRASRCCERQCAGGSPRTGPAPLTATRG